METISTRSPGETVTREKSCGRSAAPLCSTTTGLPFMFKSSRSRETEQGSVSSYGIPFSIILFWAAMTEATVPQQEKKSRIIPRGWRKKDSGTRRKKEKLASRTGLEPVLPA